MRSQKIIFMILGWREELLYKTISNFKNSSHHKTKQNTTETVKSTMVWENMCAICLPKKDSQPLTSKH